MEAILDLETRNRVARVKEIADILNVQMSSVTAALKNLKDRGMVNYEKNSYISLSEKGKKIASNIKRKHDIIKDFLTTILTMEEEEADRAACEIEHSISIEAAYRLKNCSGFINKQKIEKSISDNEWENIITR